MSPILPDAPIQARPAAPALLVRVLFCLTALAAATVPWLAARPPMVDLPQHAAQVALWRDLLAGTSPWNGLVAVNLPTPYLIGYAAMLPLVALVPAVTAAKLVLSAAVLGFVAGCVALRRAVGGDPRLDWLAPVGLFGYAWQWGFVTFLAAAPFGLWLLVLAVRQAAMPDRRRAGGIVALGLACLFAHALVFLMAGFLGGLLALLALARRRYAGTVLTLGPWLLLGLAFVLLRLATMGDAGAFQLGDINGPPVLDRPRLMLGYVTEVDGAGTVWPRPALLLMLLAPVALRLRFNRQDGVWLFGGLVALLLCLPFYAFETAGLVNRFALFLPPFSALAFARGERPTGRGGGAVVVVLIGCCWSLVGLAWSRTLAFGPEAAAFETVLAAAAPGQRALALVADPGSPAAANPQAYRHWPSWYGADKHGFVDFNFAAFPPQVVRFRPGQRPAVDAGIGWDPARYDWAAPEARLYRYVVLRGDDAFTAAMRRASPCRLDVAATAGPWTLLERTGCP